MSGIDYEGFVAPPDLVIWRYISVERFADIASGRLYFAAATQFNDPFEGSLTDNNAKKRAAALGFSSDSPEARISIKAFEDMRRLVKISCWHASPLENIAMWERYCKAAEGYVAIASTVERLKSSLHEYRIKPQYGEEPIRVGQVKYLDYATDVMDHRAMEDPFMYKRAEYRDENEVRAMISLRMAEEFFVRIPDSGIAVEVDPDRLITGIRVWSSSPEAKLDEIEGIANKAGISCGVTRSTLSRKPVF